MLVFQCLEIPRVYYNGKGGINMLNVSVFCIAGKGFLLFVGKMKKDDFPP